jgi:uncharacterized protein
MLVGLSDIISSENKTITKEVELTLPAFNAGMGEFPILEKASFTLHIANEDNKCLQVEGKTDVVIAIPCDRCLEPVAIRFEIEIHKTIEHEFLFEQETQKSECLRSLSQPKAQNQMIKLDEFNDLSCIKGTNLDVDKLIFGEILVSWPMKVLCREDCQGICKQCGANQNHKTCLCQKTEPDPRMAAIQEIFNQYKEV